jgi:hypothetical protein
VLATDVLLLAPPEPKVGPLARLSDEQLVAPATALERATKSTRTPEDAERLRAIGMQ